LGAEVWAQWDDLRHAAAVIGTVLWTSDIIPVSRLGFAHGHRASRKTSNCTATNFPQEQIPLQSSAKKFFFCGSSQR
jgi:hypothetical protein